MKKYKYGHPRFYKLLEEAAELHNNKNRQYATIDDPLGNFKRGSSMTHKLINPRIENKAAAYALLLASKQVDGSIEILGEGKKDTVDSLKDKLMDTAVYALITIILLEEGI